MAQVQVNKGSDSPLMRMGRLLAMESDLLDELNKGAAKGNAVIRTCINSKATILTSLALATTNAGMAQSLGQEVSGLIGIVGGVASIGGGLVGMSNAAKELGELKGLNDVEDSLEAVANREADAVREAGGAEGSVAIKLDRLGARQDPVDEAPLSDAQKEIERKAIELKYSNGRALASMLSQAGPTLAQGFSQLAQSPFTAIQAQEQAKAQVCQGVSETTSNLTGSTESIVQTLQGTFGSVSQLPGQSLQWAVILAQAH